MADWQRTVPHDHPALPGHFPGAPVLPGVVLLDWAWEACGALLPPASRLLGVQSAKFLRAVRPGEQLRIAVAPSESHADFTIHVGDTLAAQGRFRHGP